MQPPAPRSCGAPFREDVAGAPRSAARPPAVAARLLGATFLFGGLALGLVGCGLGGVGSCRPSLDVRVQFEVLQDGKAGRTSWDCGEPTRVRIDPGLAEGALQRVLEHELGHARGLDHLGDPACAMRSPPVLDAGFCAAEVQGAIDFDDVSRVQVLDPGLQAPTEAAMARWNEAAGRELFVLR